MTAGTFLSKPKRENSQDTVTPSDIINKQKNPQRDEAASHQPPSQPATILTETHTEREKRLMLIFDQQVGEVTVESDNHD
ncbi:hypothetical protein JOB18_024100 [Solea senegalensis]|uniref:Uncharacterized protein n=1 Tax=Solea senegalensis TaxID=28829 RepID=A0AAV6R7Z2_SOLSE|nr:hypothetical protein JOB18_024100 [Solea senegalensis]